MAVCCTNSETDLYHSYGGSRPIYRLLSPGGEIATIFNVDDPRSYYNWLLELGNYERPVKRIVPPPRFRELNDPEINKLSFEITGDHDGSVYMQCPPSENQLMEEEEFPFLNFIMTDLGGYSSIEVMVITADSPDVNGNCKLVERSIIAKNFRSRTCIGETTLEMPMRLKPSWNYVGLNLKEIVNDAWNGIHLAIIGIKINANTRLRRVYFSKELISYKNLPKEFQMNLNLSKANKEEFIDYEISLRPVLGNLKKSLRIKAEMSRKSIVPTRLGRKTFTQPVLSKTIRESEIHKQADRARGLKLSLPSNYEILDDFMNRSIQKVSDENGGQNITWKYPTHQAHGKNAENTNLGDKSRIITFADSTGRFSTENDENKLPAPGQDLMADFPKDSETNEPPIFCAYIWKQPSEDNDQGEWEKILNFDMKPQDLAKLHLQRRGEGLYDIYSGKMITMEQQKEFFGFGDEQEAKFLQKMSQNYSSRGLDFDEFETVVDPKTVFRNSMVDEDSDINFLKKAEANKDGELKPLVYEAPSKEENAGEEEKEQDDISLLQWTYDQEMNWKQTRMVNETKAKEEEPVPCNCEECACFRKESKRDSNADSKQPLEKSKKVFGTAETTWTQSVIPPKAMIKPVANDESISKWADAFYHVCFDAKVRPFPK